MTDTEMKARIRGVSAYMKSFDFLYGLILRHSDNLSRTLQRANVSAAEGQLIVTMTIKTLELLRNDNSFRLFWDTTQTHMKDLDVNKPILPRKRKAPKHYEIGDGMPEFPVSMEDHFCQIYFESLDTIMGTIKSRFDQKGYRMYINLEELLIKASQSKNYDTELTAVTDFYSSDFDISQLKTQLNIFTTNFPEDLNNDIVTIIEYFRRLSPAEHSLLPQIMVVCKLILVMPATNAQSERIFRCLKCMKSYLRSTMKQSRLNPVMLCHVY